MSNASEITQSLVPFIVEQTANGERGYDIFSRLLKDRIIYITGPINDMVASSVTAQLLLLDHSETRRPIRMYFNTPGGSVTAGMAIYDVMQAVESVIEVHVIGKAMSAGALLVAAGSQGHRYALPESTVMIHQPSAGTYGTVTDMEVDLEHFRATKRRMNEILALHTGQPLEAVEKACEKDFYFTAEEAKAFGIVDHVKASSKIEALKAQRAEEAKPKPKTRAKAAPKAKVAPKPKTARTTRTKTPAK